MRNFRHLLQEGRFDVAARFAMYLEPSRAGEHEVFAQYYLSSCQPSRAHRAIVQIEDMEQRALYAAVLLSLVAVDRPMTVKPEVAMATAPVQAKRDEQDSYRFPVESEVWADEWKVLEVKHECQKMPVIADLALREKYRRLAFQYFDQVRSELVEQNFSVVALALDVDRVPADVPHLLKSHSAHQADPYYQRLQRRLGLQEKPTVVSVNKINLDDLEIEMNGLDLSKTREVPQAIKIPMLLQ